LPANRATELRARPRTPSVRSSQTVLVTASFEPGIGLFTAVALTGAAERKSRAIARTAIFTAAGLSGPPKRRSNSWNLTCCRARSKVIKADGRLQVTLRTFVPGAAPGQVPG